VGSPLASFPALRLLMRDRFPQPVDHGDRIAGDLVEMERRFQERQARKRSS